MYIICGILPLLSALSRRVDALQISIIIIIIMIIILLLLIIPLAFVSLCKNTRYVAAFGIASGLLQEGR